VTDAFIPRPSPAHEHRGFGFVTFQSSSEARAAKEAMHNVSVHGRSAACFPACSCVYLCRGTSFYVATRQLRVEFACESARNSSCGSNAGGRHSYTEHRPGHHHPSRDTHRYEPRGYAGACVRLV